MASHSAQLVTSVSGHHHQGEDFKTELQELASSSQIVENEVDLEPGEFFDGLDEPDRDDPPHHPSHSHAPSPSHVEDAMPDPLDADEEVLHEINANFITLEDRKKSMDYIQALCAASLDDPGAGLTGDSLKHLCNPPTHMASIDDDALVTAIKLYFNLSHVDHDYEQAIESAARHLHEGQEFSLLYMIKKIVSKLSSIHPVEHQQLHDFHWL
ncbi:hypothetical protein C8R48DRAFT_781369 [Suillus tomentosus]|nr:hypothetical protein C8R48DRAFT_781369 [Suillus tomentosus]